MIDPFANFSERSQRARYSNDLKRVSRRANEREHAQREQLAALRRRNVK